MKTLLASFFLYLSTFSFSQVSGEIADDKRPILKDINYTISSKSSGILVFNISVNEAGDVTGCVLDKTASTIYSTTLMVKSKNRILTELKFERGSRYPQFHQGIVTITLEP